MNHLIAPSILSADFANLGRDIEMINESEADWIHVDVMDGRFVPNISFGFPVIEAVKEIARKPLDVHLMIAEPEKYIRDFKNSGADLLTVHYEACTHLHRTIQEIKLAEMKAGVVINPHTPVNVLEPVLSELDLVLVMSVNPGFGGQKFIEYAYTKIRQLKQLIQSTNSAAMIEVDGGVNLNNLPLLLNAGANVFVAGNSVFKSADPADTIRQMKRISSDTITV